LYYQPLHFLFYILPVTKCSSIGYAIFFIPFLYMQERQHAPSPPKSPLRGDGDAATTGISGGDVSISDAGQQAHNMGTQVPSHASRIFVQIVGC
jgi:hypothetical protein